MKYISTRNTLKEYNFEEVFIRGLAEDGGLFVPKFLNKYDEEELKTLSALSYQDLAKKIIFPFIEGFNKFQNPFRRPVAMAFFLFGTLITIYLGIGACLPIDKSLTLGLF